MRDLIERHWLAHPDDEFDRARRVLGDLAALDVATQTAVLPAGPGHSGADVVALLDRIKAENPSEPTWSGVREIVDAGSSARVEFREDFVDPPLYPAGAQQVACLLFRDPKESSRRTRGD
jgi:peptide/nickel transport system ATP-binding protein